MVSLCFLCKVIHIVFQVQLFYFLVAKVQFSRRLCTFEELEEWYLFHYLIYPESFNAVYSCLNVKILRRQQKLKWRVFLIHC